MPLALDADQLRSTFPFHVAFDADMNILQFGYALPKIFPDLHTGLPWHQFFRIDRPHAITSAAALEPYLRSLFVVNCIGRDFNLKGSILAQNDGYLFLATPVIREISALNRYGLSIHDFPLHDSIIDFMSLMQSRDQSLQEANHYGATLATQNRELDRLKLGLDKAQDAIFMVDATTLTFFYVNRQAVLQTGCSRDEMMDMTLPQLMTKLQAGDFIGMLDLFKSGVISSHTLETILQREHGTRLPVEISVQYIAGQSPQEDYFIALSRDITQRRLRDDAIDCLGTDFPQLTGIAFNEAISAHLARFLGMDYVFVGRLTPTLDAIQVMCGYACGKTMGELTYSLTDTPCAHVVGQSFCAHPSNIQSLFPKDELLIQLGIESYMGIPLFDKHGQPLGIMVALHSRPITIAAEHRYVFEMFAERAAAEMQRSHDEQTLQQLNQELKLRIEERSQALQQAEAATEAAYAANAAKSIFLANMSHELRTPLNGIIGLTELAVRTASDAVQIEQLNKIQRSSTHLLSIINSILDLSKIEATQLTLDNTPFQLQQVIDKVLTLTAHKASEKGLAFGTELAPEVARLPLRGDPLRLTQVLINLVGNAIKFTDTGHISLCIRVQQLQHDIARLYFEVRDSGIGISAEDMQNLFSPFSQLDTQRNRQHGGTGLGLAISQKLVQLMGGTIDIDSQPGGGSTFHFSLALPLSESVQHPAATVLTESAAERLKRDHTGARILLAEDDLLSQEVALWLLRDVGLEVDLARNGEEALELALTHDYDLILMDMQMPRMDGLEAAARIRKIDRHADTPILALTANAFQEDRDHCLQAGMNDHLGKPITHALLYRTVLDWLTRRHDR